MAELALAAHWPNPQQASQHFRDVMLPWCRQRWAAGDKLEIEIRLHEDALTDKQRRYYHGVILKEIAQQARPNGEVYPMAVWKEHFRKEFLGFKTVTTKNPLTGKRVRQRKRVSTEDLGVKAYSQLIERVTAFAVTDLGVVFSCPNFEQYLGAIVDPDTGEILG